MNDQEHQARNGPQQPQGSTDLPQRQRWMGLLARASSLTLAELVGQLDEVPSHQRLRGPEAGLVMVRGRAGGSGAPFNLGELSITRCSVRLASGRVGHGYVQGRDTSHAETAALIDAMLQEAEWREVLMEAVIEVLDRVEQNMRHGTASKAAATRVNFFTMARGDD